MKTLLRTTQFLLAGACLLAWGGCRHTIAVEPIEVKPIHLTLDVNLKVDRELDQFFDYEQPATTAPAAPAKTTDTPPATAPATPGGQP